MKLRNLLLFSVAALGAAALSAFSAPDFSGTWKLNLEKSDLGGMPITALQVAIEHKEPQLKYTARGTFDGQDFEEAETLSTDGKPTQDSHGNTMKAHWEGGVLVSEVTAPDGSPVYTSRMALSADGKICTRDQVPGNEQEPKRHEIYEKQ